MNELEKLAQELENELKREKNQLSLSELAELIKNRKIAKIKELFDDERHRQNIDKIFYYYDKKGRKQVANAQIVFRDEEYIAVRTEKYSINRKDYYHAVFVIGKEDGNFWIHRLEWDSNFENDNFLWTKEYIRKKMGFQTDAEYVSIEGLLQIELNETVRLQGDLCITKTGDFKSACDSLRVEIERRVFKDLIYDEFNSSEYSLLRKLTDELKKEVTEEEILEYKEEQGWKRLTEKRKKLARDMIASRKASQKLSQIKAELKQKYRDRFEKVLEKELTPRQCNFVLGNHIVAVDKAIQLRDVLNNPTNSFIVVEEAEMWVIHQEHRNKRYKLEKGQYRLDLLRRHITDRR